MERGGESGEVGWFNLYGGANCGWCGDVGEPKVDVLFYNVVENGNPAFMGGEVLSKNGHANACVPGACVCEDIVEVMALVEFGRGVDVFDQPLNERISADVGEMCEIVGFGEVVTLPFPGKVSGA